MTELLCDPQSALLFLEGQDSHYEVANWTEDDEEKVPEKAKRVKNKKKSKKKKKAEAPQKEEGKNVDKNPIGLTERRLIHYRQWQSLLFLPHLQSLILFRQVPILAVRMVLPTKRLIAQQASGNVEKRQNPAKEKGILQM